MSGPARLLALVPAHNEAANLPAVVADIRANRPDLEILVVDDGSSDGTRTVLRTLGVRWLSWPDRRGVGGAVRAGLRYADRLGFDGVVRLDADGQHAGADIARLLGPIGAGDADAVLGSRFTDGAAPGVLQRALALVVSIVCGRRITDATSGLWALGPRAVALLAEHHPRGYPEPELHLFLSRNGLRVREVAVGSRARLSGRSSLTPGRVVAAGARVALAVLIVPLRARIGP